MNPNCRIVSGSNRFRPSKTIGVRIFSFNTARSTFANSFQSVAMISASASVTASRADEANSASAIALMAARLCIPFGS